MTNKNLSIIPYHKQVNKFPWAWAMTSILLIIIVLGIFAFFILSEEKRDDKHDQSGLIPLQDNTYVLQCELVPSFQRVEVFDGDSTSVFVSGFQGKPSDISWQILNPNIASSSSFSGQSFNIDARKEGSTQIIATDYSVGSDCSVSILLVVEEPETNEEDTISEVDETIDCGTDMDCFIETSEDCSSSELLYTATIDFLGLLTTTTTFMEIIGFESGKCIYHQRTEGVSIEFSDDAVQQMLENGLTQEQIDQQEQATNDAAQESVGEEKTCEFDNSNDLTSILEKWKQGDASTSDWDVANCY